MSSIPASAMQRARSIAPTSIPQAPPAICILAMSGHSWIFVWGRSLTPASPASRDISAMFDSRTSIYTMTAGVSMADRGIRCSFMVSSFKVGITGATELAAGKMPVT